MSLLPKKKVRVVTNVDKSRSPFIIPFAILGVMTLLAASSALFGLRHGGNATAGGTGDAVPALTNVNATSFSGAGPFGVGETTLHLSSNGAPVVVWYPTSADNGHGKQATFNLATLLPASLKALFPNAVVSENTDGVLGVPVADGRFPLVVFSHGFAGFATQSAFLTSHLASWGFVVAAPEHLDRDLTAALTAALTGTTTSSSTDVADLEETLSLMGGQNASSSSPFYRHLDMSRIGAVGHSAGGSAVEKLAVADSKVKVFIGLAGASYGSFGQTATGAGSKVPSQPGMLMYGTQDSVVQPGSIKNAYNAMKQPKRLIGLTNSGHLVFANICKIGQSGGGLVGAAQQLGLTVPASLLPLGLDGCSYANIPVTQQWPVIDQAVTAELRVELGYDQTQAGLTGLVQAYGMRVAQNTTANTVSGADASAVGTGNN